MSFLAIYVIDERGYRAKTYGALALVANLGQALANAWAGELSDRIDASYFTHSALHDQSVLA